MSNRYNGGPYGNQRSPSKLGTVLAHQRSSPVKVKFPQGSRTIAPQNRDGLGFGCFDDLSDRSSERNLTPSRKYANMQNDFNR